MSPKKAIQVQRAIRRQDRIRKTVAGQTPTRRNRMAATPIKKDRMLPKRIRLRIRPTKTVLKNRPPNRVRTTPHHSLRKQDNPRKANRANQNPRVIPAAILRRSRVHHRSSCLTPASPPAKTTHRQPGLVPVQPMSPLAESWVTMLRQLHHHPQIWSMRRKRPTWSWTT